MVVRELAGLLTRLPLARVAAALRERAPAEDETADGLVLRQWPLSAIEARPGEASRRRRGVTAFRCHAPHRCRSTV